MSAPPRTKPGLGDDEDWVKALSSRIFDDRVGRLPASDAPVPRPVAQLSARSKADEALARLARAAPEVAALLEGHARPFGSDGGSVLAPGPGTDGCRGPIAPGLANGGAVALPERPRIVAPPAPEAAPPAPEAEPPAVEAPPAALRLGDLLLATGAVDADHLQAALAEQHRTGARLGEVLTRSGAVSEEALTRALAIHLDLPFHPLAEAPPAEVLQLLPQDLMLRRLVVPLGIDDRGVLELAMVDPLDDAAIDEAEAAAGRPVQVVVAPETAVDSVIQQVHAEEHVDKAVLELVRQRPEESAYKVLSPGQKRFGIALIVLGLVSLAIAPITTIVVFNMASIAFYFAFSLYRFTLVWHAMAHEVALPVTDEEVAALDERDLPVYTVLVPLYKEAAILPRLIDGLAGLDYPATLLDVKVLAEADDEETIEAFHRLAPPPHIKLVVVPDALPKTKPKACNYGLLHARGQYVVIFDAEDKPEPDQLKKVVCAFNKADAAVTCVQCKLNYYNRRQNVLTRWFTTEYSMWFDVYMPGLDAAGSPIPLGGTSNHFQTDVLISLGAWDPYNVAEDADLGIRLSKAGLRTAVVDSTTFEEANSDVHNWIRQRSRWVKGYMQTWLVHMRHPVQLWRQLGTRRFWSFQLTVGGTFLGFLLNPIYWLLSTVWIATEAGVIKSLFPSFVYYAAASALILGNFVFAYVNVAGSMRRGYYDLVRYALFSPVYWALMSMGAWKGAIQLVTKPFYWEKTIHGLDDAAHQ